MSGRTSFTLAMVALATASTAYSQGVHGPSGSGAMSAEKQAQSSDPGAKAGNRGTDSRMTTTEGGHSAAKTAREQRSASNPVDADGTANSRSASGNSRNATAPDGRRPGQVGQDGSTESSTKKP